MSSTQLHHLNTLKRGLGSSIIERATTLERQKAETRKRSGDALRDAQGLFPEVEDDEEEVDGDVLVSKSYCYSSSDDEQDVEESNSVIKIIASPKKQSNRDRIPKFLIGQSYAVYIDLVEYTDKEGAGNSFETCVLERLYTDAVKGTMGFKYSFPTRWLPAFVQALEKLFRRLPERNQPVSARDLDQHMKKNFAGEKVVR